MLTRTNRTPLLLATHNRGKLREFCDLFGALPFNLVTLEDVGLPEDVEETGATFEENARLKAEVYARRSGLLTLADDSGLEVDALGGEPGVRSKRYAGPGKSDAQRIDFLLEKLKGVPSNARQARFRSVIVIAEPEGRAWVSEGRCEGRIGFTPRGTGGFGYDPIFIMGDDPAGRTMGELPEEEKNRLSHRARAATGAREILRSLGAERSRT